MKISVRAHPVGSKLHRLEVMADGQSIGEYERSQAADIERKVNEVRCAAEQLVEIHRRFGEFKVRWIAERKAKVITVDGIERGVVPKQCWEKPSWA